MLNMTRTDLVTAAATESRLIPAGREREFGWRPQGVDLVNTWDNSVCNQKRDLSASPHHFAPERNHLVPRPRDKRP